MKLKRVLCVAAVATAVLGGGVAAAGSSTADPSCSRFKFLSGGDATVELQETAEQYQVNGRDTGAYNVVTTQDGNAGDYQVWLVSGLADGNSQILNARTGDVLQSTREVHNNVLSPGPLNVVASPAAWHLPEQEWRIVWGGPGLLMELINASTHGTLTPVHGENYLGNPAWHPVVDDASSSYPFDPASPAVWTLHSGC